MYHAAHRALAPEQPLPTHTFALTTLGRKKKPRWQCTFYSASCPWSLRKMHARRGRTAAQAHLRAHRARRKHSSRRAAGSNALRYRRASQGALFSIPVPETKTGGALRAARPNTKRESTRTRASRGAGAEQARTWSPIRRQHPIETAAIVKKVNSKSYSHTSLQLVRAYLARTHAHTCTCTCTLPGLYAHPSPSLMVINR